ncbi:hypothetical protein AB0H37_05070 [Actinomadura sp. NPDC023710]|uniref:hypothetical protein n=1 Tax=Actinomadura sp. NPDC023710 TaxID=3158219 RepID=UPI0033CFBAE3
MEAPNGFLSVVFVAHRWEGDPVNAEPNKHSQVAWHPVDKVPVEFVSTTGAALLNYLRGGPMVTAEGF